MADIKEGRGRGTKRKLENNGTGGKKSRGELATARQLPLEGPKPWNHVPLLPAGPLRCVAAHHQAVRDNA